MNNITAKNYVGQACKGLTKIVEYFESVNLTDDAKRLKTFISSARDKAVHFAIPDDAIFFDTKQPLAGLKGISVRLPFPTITIEYFQSTYRESVEFMSDAPKRIILVEETHPDDPYQGIVISAAYTVEGSWTPCILGWFISYEWDAEKPPMETLQKTSFVEGGVESSFIGSAVIAVESVYYDIANMSEAEGRQDRMISVYNDILLEVKAVLSMLEVLACKNVSHEVLYKANAAINARRIKKGKLPFYETKMLVVNTNEKQINVDNYYDSMNKKNSQRVHLRRGHIRKLPNCNIWVNSCVVGDKSKGLVNKSYKIK